MIRRSVKPSFPWFYNDQTFFISRTNSIEFPRLTKIVLIMCTLEFQYELGDRWLVKLTWHYVLDRVRKYVEGSSLSNLLQSNKLSRVRRHGRLLDSGPSMTGRYKSKELRILTRFYNAEEISKDGYLINVKTKWKWWQYLDPLKSNPLNSWYQKYRVTVLWSINEWKTLYFGSKKSKVLCVLVY